MRIRWIVAIAAVGATGVTMLLADADAQNAIVEETQPVRTLSGPERAQLATWISSVWPDSTPARISSLECCRDTVCRMRWLANLTASEFNAYEDADQILKYNESEIAEDGTSIGNVEIEQTREITAAQRSALGDVVASVFAVPKPLLQCVHLWTVYADDSFDVIARRGRVTLAQAKTPVERLACLKTGACRKRLGTVVGE